jgi:O-antigen biosynthesis protein WbqP
MKRVLDFIFSVILLIILSPVLIIVSIIIKFDSKGPVFFRQRRIGLNKKEFLIYKFRTMQINTPELATDKFSNSETYITKVGNVLRKTSIDELPQLINIIMGEMSFVGPRPALYNQYELIELRDSKGVNNCIPGITGYAQINGRDNISNEDKVRYDEYYFKNKSLLLDAKIVFKTIFKVAMRKDITN